MGSWVRTERDGILKQCSKCGDYAGYRPSVNGEGPTWSVYCTNCNNHTEYMNTKFEAAVEWNKSQD